MIKSIKIEGVEGVLGSLKKFENDLSNPQEPLRNTGNYMRNEAILNFPAEGAIFEEKWDPLTPYTIRKKAQLGYEGQPMMVRTGLLRGSFRASEPTVNPKLSSIEIFNPVDYATTHQYIGVGRRLTKRVLLKLARKQRNDIVKTFSDWVSQLINRSFGTK